MNITDLTPTITDAWPFLVSAAGALVLALVLVAFLTRRGTRHRTGDKMTLENKLTFLVAVIIAGVCAQGMGLFFYKELGFPLELVIVVGGVLELTAFTCALRARRNIREQGRAGVDGAAVWGVTALSGVFSAMEADSAQVAVFRLVMPLLAAWLWERGMSIERRKARGGSTIHWRVTPERVLVWLRVAEPSGRTASEVDAHRRLTRVAKAAAHLRTLRINEAWHWRIERAERHLERAMRSAVAHAGLAQDPTRQEALIAQIGSLYNAGKLADLTPDAPWSGFAIPANRTLFEALGVPFVQAEVLPPETGPAAASSTPSSGARSGDSSAPPVGASSDRQNARQATPRSVDNTDATAGDNKPAEVAATRRQRSPRSGGKNRKRRARRSMTEWVDLAGPVFHAEFTRLQRQPTADEFAEAIKKAGHGTVSASTAKNIRTEILDRAPLPSID